VEGYAQANYNQLEQSVRVREHHDNTIAPATHPPPTPALPLPRSDAQLPPTPPLCPALSHTAPLLPSAPLRQGLDASVGRLQSILDELQRRNNGYNNYQAPVPEIEPEEEEEEEEFVPPPPPPPPAKKPYVKRVNPFSTRGSVDG
jgi:hypothetical protein